MFSSSSNINLNFKQSTATNVLLHVFRRMKLRMNTKDSTQNNKIFKKTIKMLQYTRDEYVMIVFPVRSVTWMKFFCSTASTTRAEVR